MISWLNDLSGQITVTKTLGPTFHGKQKFFGIQEGTSAIPGILE